MSDKMIDILLVLIGGGIVAVFALCVMIGEKAWAKFSDWWDHYVRNNKTKK